MLAELTAITAEGAKRFLACWLLIQEQMRAVSNESHFDSY